jgi:predicted ATPase
MKQALSSVHVQGFKAVKDSGVLKLGGLTVFIGNNGAGKSSILEALRFLADLSRGTLDQTLEPFRGYEHLRWKGGTKRGSKPGRTAPGVELKEFYPLTITARGHVGTAKITASTRITGQNLNEVVFEREELTVGTQTTARDPGLDPLLRPDRSILGRTSWFDTWQFLDLVPDRMGTPTPLNSSGGGVRLARDGSNVAEYLRDLRADKERGADAFEGLLEVLQVILPYARDLEPMVNEGFGRQVALRLHEGTFSVPGWMLSTGTLRLIALLALLRHPRPPSLICIEELENGLDPRTTDLVVNEILRATEAGRTQVIVTTHSPYLLDLVPLESLVLVAREEGGPPFFDRPAEHAEVVSWAERFAPGRLYTMGTLNRRRDQLRRQSDNGQLRRQAVRPRRQGR